MGPCWILAVSLQWALVWYMVCNWYVLGFWFLLEALGLDFGLRGFPQGSAAPEIEMHTLGLQVDRWTLPLPSIRILGSSSKGALLRIQLSCS